MLKRSISPQPRMRGGSGWRHGSTHEWRDGPEEARRPGARVARGTSGDDSRATGRSLMGMAVIAHIAGIPVEETVATFAPVVAVAGGCCVARLRASLRRIRG